jgi:hypothetical protein
MRRTPVLLLAAALGSALVASGAVADTTTTTSTSTTTTTEATTTTTLKPVYVAPLTGLPDPTGVTRHRAALTIKIDNTPEAHPQYGIEDADDVFEEIVEGGITRLAAIFDTRYPAQVGPVRSVRRTDREIVFPIRGVFAFSGGAEYAVRSIETAPVKLYDQSNAGAAMWRDPDRYPPHNLFANAALLMEMAHETVPPPPLFTYQAPKGVAPGRPVASFVVGFQSGFAVTYTWDTATRSWDRSIFGAPDVAATGQRISPKNVVVMSVNYIGGVGVIDSYAELVGSGPVQVFTRGTLQKGTWSRRSLRKRAVFKNAQGQVINLTPGQTFVELLDVSEQVTVTPRP